MRKITGYIFFLTPLVLFIASFVLQYGFGYQPCNLCFVERYIYLALSACLLLYFVTKKFPVFFIPALIGLCVSVYHKMVQIGVFSTCHIFGNYNNIEEFSAMVSTAVPCNARMVILGVDAVWFNIVLFAFYAISFLLRSKLKKIFD